MKKHFKFISVLMLAVVISACSTKPIDEALIVSRVDVGKVTNVEYSRVTAKPALVTVLLGAAVGGVVGHQFGGGSGKKWATGIGAVAGGAITDEALTKRYNQVVYDVYFPNTNERISIVSPNVTSNIKDNDLVVVYQKDKKIKIDAYGVYTEDKYTMAQKKLAEGTLD